MKHKKLKITLSVIVGIIVLLFALYKVSYNALAPMVFDFVVSKNPEALLKLDEMAEEPAVSQENTESVENTEKENVEPETKEETKPAENNTASKTTEQPKSNKVYSTETYIGTLTTADMAHVIKTISSADKTRIISICKSVVAASDMPRFAKMATQGMSGDDYAYAESYLRIHLSPVQKQEIMEIVRKYLGR